MDKDKLIDVKQTFAFWCASTAARSSPKCRFPGAKGIDIARNSFLLCYRTLDELFMTTPNRITAASFFLLLLADRK
jgi:hypothetical protein